MENINNLTNKTTLKAKLAVCSCEVPEKERRVISSLCESLVLLPPDRLLAEPVAAHPDMIFASVGGKIIFHEAYYWENRSAVDKIADLSGCELVLSNCPRNAKYPFDAAFNVLLLGKYMFCKEDITAPEILKAARDASIQTVNVKQGYSACSCLAGNNFIVTSDKSILKAAAGKAAVLEISQGYIILEPYNTGFIGGASFIFSKEAWTFGSLREHPDRDKIKKFLSSHGCSLHETSNESLRDFGGVKFF